jgi:hypothetical protein
MTYRPVGGGNVTHFGLSMPLPTLQIKSLTLGGVTTQWRFSRASASSGPPDVYIHRWKPLYGLGPIDPGPAEAARQKAAAPPCKAPPSR